MGHHGSRGWWGRRSCFGTALGCRWARARSACPDTRGRCGGGRAAPPSQLCRTGLRLVWPVQEEVWEAPPPCPLSRPSVVVHWPTGDALLEQALDAVPEHHHVFPSGSWTGMLTRKGVHQGQALGTRLRHQYVDGDDSLLPHAWDPSAVYLRSTNILRTITTLQVGSVGVLW